MECPKCGFSQPDDKYCASCGLDIEAYLAKPRPMLFRMLQNPNFYGILIGGILVLLAGYIFTNQRAVGRQMGRLLHHTYLMSKDAADPNATDNTSESPATPSAAAESAAATAETPETSADSSPDKSQDAAANYANLEVGFFELSKDSVAALNARVVRDDGEWKSLYVEDAKEIESIKQAAAKLPGIREKSLQKDAVELDAGDVNPDNQLPYLAIGVDWTKGDRLRWAVGMQIPVNAGSSGAARNVADVSPPQMQPTNLEGSVNFKPQGALLLVYDPANRTSSGFQDSARIEHSPLRVYASDDFRSGYSDLVVWIRCK